MTRYQKPAYTIQQHIDLLKGRGLLIDDESYARHYLNNISYFRLSAYTRPFYQNTTDTNHTFKVGTRFEDVLNLYVFDRELRLTLLDAIERIEISLRAQLTNAIALTHGCYGYLDQTLFKDNYDHQWLCNKLQQDTQSPKAEHFIKHYLKSYPASSTEPPIWMALELLTFKEVSTLFAQLKNTAIIQAIEQHYGYKFPLLASWFRSLSDLRNSCAHHARVWNREFGSTPQIPKKPPKDWIKPPAPIVITTANGQHTIQPNKRLFMQVVVIHSLMKTACPDSQWIQRFAQLIDTHKMTSLPNMGFTANWRADAFWQLPTSLEQS